MTGDSDSVMVRSELSRAVILAPGTGDGFELLGEGIVPEFFEIFGRPAVRFVVEALVDRGVREVDWMLGERPSAFREYFGSGERWGVLFRYHLCPSPARMAERLRVLEGDVNQRIGIFSSRVIPVGGALPDRDGWIGNDPATAGDSVGQQPWGILARMGDLRELSRREGDFWEAVVTGHEPGDPPFSGIDFRRLEYLPGLIETAFRDRKFLRHVVGKVPGSNGWIQRGVVLHPTARLVEPFFIGEECRIERNATIGPGAVVGSGCLIDEGAEVAESVLAPGTYLGRLAAMERAIVVGSRLVNLRIGGAIDVEDAFILGSLAGRKKGQIASGLLDWLVGFGLWILTIPWRLKECKTRYRVVSNIGADGKAVEVDVAGLYRGGSSFTPRSYFRTVIVPGLQSVVRGRIGLIGFPLRSADDWSALPGEHRRALAGTRAGLISESLLRHGPQADETLQRAADIVTLRDGGIRRWLLRGLSFAGHLVQNRWSGVD